MTIEELQNIAVSFRNEREWKKVHSPKDMVMGLICEAAELMEHFKYRNGKELDNYLLSHKKEISEELSDVLFWVLLIGKDFNIDIVKEYKEKMKKNAIKYPL